MSGLSARDRKALAAMCEHGGCVLPSEHEGPHYDPSDTPDARNSKQEDANG